MADNIKPKPESSKMQDNITMTKDELEDMLENGITSSDPKERLNQFVLWRIQQYTLNKWKTLSAIFSEEFQQFTAKEDFEAIKKFNITMLRDCLRNNGVYVKKARLYPIAQALADVVKEDIPWPLNDEDRPPPKQQQPVQQLQQPIQQQAQYYSPQMQPQQVVPPENAIHLPPQPPNPPENIAPILPLYGPNYRIPHQLPSPHQVIQDYGTKQSHGHSKELTALAKMYTSEEKYGGSPTESLSYKFTIFMDLCTRAGIPQQTVQTAFPTMLKSMALEYYYSSCQGIGLTVQQLFDRFQGHFEGEEHRRNMLRQWNSINLKGLFRTSPEKNKGTVFNEMILQLRQIQRGLDYEFQSDTALRNKIVMSCSNIPACNVAILQQTTTIAGLINNIYAAIENNEEAMKAEKSDPLGPTTYFTDRKYYTNRPFNRPPPSSSPSNNGFQKKKCFVCGKTGCWSTKHTDKERQESRNKFAKRFTSSIDKRYDSYIQEYEGQEEENVEDFEALTLDIQDDLEEAENFVTAISTVTSDQAHARYLEDKGCDALQRLIDTNQLDLELEGWVERQDIDQ